MTNIEFNDDFLTLDVREREASFIEYKGQKSNCHVHRLHEWETDDIVWGYDIVTEDHVSSGKTYPVNDDDTYDGEFDLVPGHVSARKSYTNQIRTHGPPFAAFLWVARINNVWTGGSMGEEPPLKYANFNKMHVVESTYCPAHRAELRWTQFDEIDAEEGDHVNVVYPCANSGEVQFLRGTVQERDDSPSYVIDCAGSEYRLCEFRSPLHDDSLVHVIQNLAPESANAKFGGNHSQGEECWVEVKS